MSLRIGKGPNFASGAGKDWSLNALTVAVTKDEAQRRRWTFHEAVKLVSYLKLHVPRQSVCHPRRLILWIENLALSDRPDDSVISGGLDADESSRENALIRPII